MHLGQRWESLINKATCADWHDFCATIPDGVVNLLFLDPPYNIGVFCKMSPDKYLDWCKEWIVEGNRILAPNGAFWVSHKNPEVLVDISREIARLGRGRVNWVTWDTWNDLRFRWERGEDLYPPFGALWKHVCRDALRSFGQCAEYLVYHADEGDWVSQCDRERGFIFEPLRAYLTDEWNRAGLSKVDANIACGFSPSLGGMASRHYFSRSQWRLPTSEHYIALRAYANSHNGNGDYLRREYEDLRAEFNDLRYTFNNPGRVSSVWQIPPAQRNGHPTPKPPALLARIIEATSNPGDLVCDFFAGSFTTATEAQRLGRKWLCCDVNPEYVGKYGSRPFQPSQLNLGLDERKKHVGLDSQTSPIR